MKEKMKFGYLKAGKCVSINLLYFKPCVDFDIYVEATKFKWDVPEEQWSQFAHHLVVNGLGQMYTYVDENLLSPPRTAVQLVGIKDGKVINHSEVMALEDCKDIAEVDKSDSTRVFQIDQYAPTRMGMRQLQELWPDVDQYLSAQKIGYVAYAIQSINTNPDVREEIEKFVQSSEQSEEWALRIAQVAEARHAIRRTKESVEEYGFSISGMTAPQEGDPNILYTSGLSNEGTYEIFCREKLAVDLMAPMISFSAKLATKGYSALEINEQLAKASDFRQYKPRLVLTRREKIEDIFVYRVKESFDVYRLTLSL